MQLGTHTEYVLSLGEDYDRKLVVGHTIQYSIRFCFAPTGFALTEVGNRQIFTMIVQISSRIDIVMERRKQPRIKLVVYVYLGIHPL